MQMSEHGLALLAEWEGLSEDVYRDAGGKLTIGYGHLLTREELMGHKWAEGITKKEALALLAADIKHAEDAVNDLVKLSLHQSEFDALVSFVFNVGTGAFKKSALLKKLNLGNLPAVPTEMRKWVRAGGKRCQGLANRREKEIALWSGKLWLEKSIASPAAHL